MKVVKWLDEHFEEALLVALLVVIACVELAQVVARNVPFMPALTWAEELCRFCWIASVFISLPYTIRKGNMLRVNVVVDMLPTKVRNAINVVVDLITAAAMGLLGYYAIGVFENVYITGQTSPAMLLPMWIMYLFVLFGFIAGCLRGIQQAVLQIMHFSEAGATFEEQVMAEAADEIGAVLEEAHAEAAKGGQA